MAVHTSMAPYHTLDSCVKLGFDACRWFESGYWVVEAVAVG
jgi:hypothetical protein